MQVPRVSQPTKLIIHVIGAIILLYLAFQDKILEWFGASGETGVTEDIKLWVGIVVAIVAAFVVIYHSLLAYQYYKNQ
jgi:H+/Cl- antiporter ClcA